jgi:hypothetical protein
MFDDLQDDSRYKKVIVLTTYISVIDQNAPILGLFAVSQLAYG